MCICIVAFSLFLSRVRVKSQPSPPLPPAAEPSINQPNSSCQPLLWLLFFYPSPDLLVCPGNKLQSAASPPDLVSSDPTRSAASYGVGVAAVASPADSAVNQSISAPGPFSQSLALFLLSSLSLDTFPNSRLLLVPANLSLFSRARLRRRPLRDTIASRAPRVPAAAAPAAAAVAVASFSALTRWSRPNALLSLRLLFFFSTATAHLSSSS